jgi:DNA-binding NarL/FixJ family response regulator
VTAGGTTQPSASDGGLEVLVVDDSPDIRELISIVISGPSVGWRVVGVAEDGEQAVAEARRTQPHLVLLDIAMPVMDGIQALPLIIDAAPRAVVVMLSGYGAATAGDAAMAAGAHGYLEKEDLVHSLVPRLQAIIADSRVDGDGAAP